MSRIRADKIVNGAGTGAPSFPKGIILSGVSTITADITSADISAENATFSGIITSASLSVSGNVSVGGTLTYEDVTSIDSVGVITARSGIHVTGGRVGIGTDNPTEDLHVYEAGGSPIIKVETTSPTGGTTLQLKGGSGRIDFGVTGGSSNRGRILYANAANTLNGAAGDRMEFFTNNDLSNSAILITSDNKIGIGTVIPNRKLVISQTNSTAYSGTDFDQDYHVLKLNNFTDSNATVGMQFLIGSNGEAAITATETSDGATDLAFGTRGGGNRAERLRITSHGNMRLDHNQSGSQIAMSDGNLYFSDAWSSTNGANTVFTIASGGYANIRFRGNQGTDSEITLGVGNGSYYMAYDELNNIHRLTLTNATGVISGDFNDTSDEKLKENITTIADGQIDLIKQLRPVNFDWKNGTLKGQSGFIAQEIKAVIPDLVQGEEYDENEFGSVGYSVNTNGLVSHLTKALQEAIAKIETLESKVAALEG